MTSFESARTYRSDVYDRKSKQVRICTGSLCLHGDGVDDEVGVGHAHGSRGRPRRNTSKLGAVIERKDQGLAFESVEAVVP